MYTNLDLWRQDEPPTLPYPEMETMDVAIHVYASSPNSLLQTHQNSLLSSSQNMRRQMGVGGYNSHFITSLVVIFHAPYLLYFYVIKGRSILGHDICVCFYSAQQWNRMTRTHMGRGGQRGRVRLGSYDTLVYTIDHGDTLDSMGLQKVPQCT